MKIGEILMNNYSKNKEGLNLNIINNLLKFDKISLTPFKEIKEINS